MHVFRRSATPTLVAPLNVTKQTTTVFNKFIEADCWRLTGQSLPFFLPREYRCYPGASIL